MMCRCEFALEFRHWTNMMRGEKSPFAERDTILHLILPVLNAIGFSPEMIVQGNNDNNSKNRLWDVNCYSFRLTNLIEANNPKIQQPLLVIEAKSANIPFCTAYSECESNNTITWIPGFTKIKNVEDFLRLINNESNINKNEPEYSKNTQAKKNRIDQKLQGLKLDRSSLRNQFSQLLENIAKRYDMINGIISGRIGNWTPQERDFLRFVLKDGINSDNHNFFGEVWRDCTDGKHVFADKMTIPILTNGIEWLFMKPDFYATDKIPKIVWHKKDGYGCITSEDNDAYLKSFTIPIDKFSEMNFVEACDDIFEIIDEMHQYIISRVCD